MRLCLGRQTSFWGCISKRIHNGGHSSPTKSWLKRERERDGYRPQWQSLVPMTREMDHTNSHSHKRIHTWPLILAAFKNEREREGDDLLPPKLGLCRSWRCRLRRRRDLFADEMSPEAFGWTESFYLPEMRRCRCEKEDCFSGRKITSQRQMRKLFSSAGCNWFSIGNYFPKIIDNQTKENMENVFRKTFSFQTNRPLSF